MTKVTKITDTRTSGERLQDAMRSDAVYAQKERLVVGKPCPTCERIVRRKP